MLVTSARWVIHPQNPARYSYLVFIVVLTFVNLITIPLDMAFSEDMHGLTHTCWISFNVFSDIIFCIDIAVNFHIGIYTKDAQIPILEPRFIRNDYLKTWFVPDVLAAFPTDVIILIIEQQYHADTSSLMASKMMRIVMMIRLVSMIRVLRFARLLRYSSKLQSISGISGRTFRLLHGIVVGLLIWHWNGCIQYMSMLEELSLDSWVQKQNLTDASIGKKYSFGLARAFHQMTWTSSGCADLQTRVWEQWTMIISMCTGLVMVSRLIAFLLKPYFNSLAANNMFMKKLHNLKSSSIHLPRDLHRRNAYYKTKYSRRDIQEDIPDLFWSKALEELSDDLQ